MPRTDRLLLVNAMLGPVHHGVRRPQLRRRPSHHRQHAPRRHSRHLVCDHRLPARRDQPLRRVRPARRHPRAIRDLRHRVRDHGGSAFFCGVAPSVVWEHKRHKAPCGGMSRVLRRGAKAPDTGQPRPDQGGPTPHRYGAGQAPAPVGPASFEGRVADRLPDRGTRLNHPRPAQSLGSRMAVDRQPARVIGVEVGQQQAALARAGERYVDTFGS